MFESLESRRLMSVNLPEGAIHVAAGDVNGDGRAELAVGSANGGIWKTNGYTKAPAQPPTMTQGIIAVLIAL